MKLTPEILVIGTGVKLANAQRWIAPLQAAFDAYGIVSDNAIAAFLANVGVESAGLSRLVENLNYSAQGLANTWPSRYATVPRTSPLTPNTVAVRIANQPEQIANMTYGGRADLGNGAPDTGDGWKFRGRGLLQTTGRYNYAQTGTALNLDLINDPDQLAQPEAAALSAAWFFSRKGCIILSDQDDFSDVVKIINGSVPTTANQGQLRISRYMATKKALAAA